MSRCEYYKYFLPILVNDQYTYIYILCQIAQSLIPWLAVVVLPCGVLLLEDEWTSIVVVDSVIDECLSVEADVGWVGNVDS